MSSSRPDSRLSSPAKASRGAPKNGKKIDWKLITDRPIRSRKDAIEKHSELADLLDDDAQSFSPGFAPTSRID
jgi:hypothetical protein